MLFVALSLARTTAEYWACFLWCLLSGCNIERVPILQHDTFALVHVFSLAKTLHLWHRPHYRAPTFAHDLRANLQNVAIPGTALFFFLVVNPIACLLGALYLSATGAPASAAAPPPQQQRGGSPGVGALYRELLLAPSHWLATWRANCVLVAWHATAGGALREYALEDKGHFLLAADRLGLPVAPFVKAPRVFVKHRSVEGGQGIHVYDSFTSGGEWIISEAMENAPCLARMLPRGAPLSTFRIVTASVVWLEEREAQRLVGGSARGLAPTPRSQQQQQLGDQRPSQQHPGFRTPSPALGRGAPRSPSPGIRSLMAGRRSRAGAVSTGGSRPPSRSPPLPVSTSVRHTGRTPLPGGDSDDDDGGGSYDGGGGGGGGWHSPSGAPTDASDTVYERSIEVLTGVFRAGLAGADTDHTSICFPVDESGELGRGVTATHWYRRGWRAALTIPASARASWDEHPQSGCLVAGAVVPGWWSSVAALTLQAHALLAPGVPLVGWDVALPAEPEGPVLLEANISCNCFNGHLDVPGYADFLYAYFAELGRTEDDAAAVARRRR